MNYHKCDNEQEKMLTSLLLDSESFKAIEEKVGSFNMFEILGISRWEIKHSNMLAWLFTPSASHGLGDSFLKGVIERILSKESNRNNKRLKDEILELLLLDTNSCYVRREWKNIDILIASPKEPSQDSIVITIENKVGSKEHGNQLKKYYEIIENESEYKDYKHKLYIYLTPEGSKSSDSENWIILSYEDIVAVLEGILGTQQDLNAEIRMLIKHYMDNVRRNIVGDRELENLCNAVYMKHKEAFDTIYKYKTIGESRMAEAIGSVIDKYDKEGKIIKTDDCALGFYTKVMDEKLPPLNEPISSWKTNRLYQFWFKIREYDEYCTFYLVFELGGKNVPEEQKAMMQKLIDKHKPNKKRQEFKYYRILKTATKEINNDDDNFEENVEKAAIEAIDEMLRKQMEV